MSFADLITAVNDVIWSPALIWLCLIVGLYFTIRTMFLQFVNIPDMVKQLREGQDSADGTSSLQSLMMSLAGRVGMGNIGGVATAIAFGVLVVGIITGIDGSGFSGLPLTGALAGALAPVANADPTTLAAIGQIGSIWTGGGTLVAWSSLIAIAGFVRVPVLELVRALFLPVVAGLFVATLAAVVLW